MTTRLIAPLALACIIAMPVPAHAGGLAPGGAPSGWGGYEAPSVGNSRDGIRNYEGCSGNKALCPRRGSDWWKARERERELLRPKPKPRDPVEEIANPGGGIPETPTRPETPGETPGTPDPTPVPAVPLPATLWLALTGLGALIVRRPV